MSFQDLSVLSSVAMFVFAVRFSSYSTLLLLYCEQLCLCHLVFCPTCF